MIIALILLIVFLVIGTSVLTAASASVGRAAALREEKQLYYFARSVASTFTEGMTDLWGTVWGPVNKMLEADRCPCKTCRRTACPTIFCRKTVPGSIWSRSH